MAYLDERKQQAITLIESEIEEVDECFQLALSDKDYELTDEYDMQLQSLYAITELV